jgi:hypothetical protein
MLTSDPYSMPWDELLLLLLLSLPMFLKSIR